MLVWCWGFRHASKNGENQGRPVIKLATEDDNLAMRDVRVSEAGTFMDAESPAKNVRIEYAFKRHASLRGYFKINH